MALVAVMKAGGAFVPLDPSHPTSRLKGLAQAVGASTLLCSRHHVETLAPVVETVIPIDWEAINNLPEYLESSSHISRAKPSNAAYVIFTSGSTGEPKVSFYKPETQYTN